MQLSEYNVSSLIQKISSIEDTLSSGACYDIVDKLVDFGVDWAMQYDAQAPRSGDGYNTISPISPKLTKSTVRGGIQMQGDDAIYDEFGTGEEGAADPHPMKNQFSQLNPYNSGPIVSKNVNPKNGRHYWYYPPMDGKPYFNFPDEGVGYTEGIPSGKQMYNTLQDLRKNERSIATFEINKAIAEINKAINKFK